MAVGEEVVEITGPGLIGPIGGSVVVSLCSVSHFFTTIGTVR